MAYGYRSRRTYSRGYRPRSRGYSSRRKFGYTYPSRRFYGMRPRRYYIGGRRY